MRSLHVCFRAGSDRNCGNCEKCLRTMVMLEISGHLADCGTFPRRTLDLDAVSRILVPTAEDEIFYESIRRRAAERGRSDLVRAVNRCLRRSRVVRGVTAAAHGLDGRRLAWRAGRWLRHRAMSGAIR